MGRDPKRQVIAFAIASVAFVAIGILYGALDDPPAARDVAATPPALETVSPDP
jgi:hypothetical protein